MRPLHSLNLLWLLLLALTGCTSSTPSPIASATGAMQLAVYLPGALPADVSRVTVTVSGPDMSSLSVDLALSDGAWGGVLSDLPAGPHRTFLAQAFTSSNTLRYQGQADDVTVTASTTGLVSLTLQDVSPPPPFSNEAPIIDSLVASVTPVAPGASLSLTSSAHDPNSGDTLTYSWSAPSGSFSAPTLANTSWTAPSTQGPVQLTLKVSDSRGASLSETLTVNVSLGTGADQVNVGFNVAPKLVSLTSSQSVLDVGQQTSLSLSATDGDGDSLSYQWTATCSGSFTGATSPSATFTPSALPTAACNNCQLVVTVKDGRGGTNTASLALCVAKDSRRAPPSLTRSYQSSLTAKAGQQLTFEVGASDPAGSALSFAWTATVGTLGTASTSATSSRNTWTAPTCAASGSTPGVTATVSNTYGLKTTKGFTVTGLPTCASVGSWTPTGSMVVARYEHGATTLPNGKVLVMGGRYSSDLYSAQSSAEVYDPATGTWGSNSSMITPRDMFRVTALPSGTVLVTGGKRFDPLSTSEVYDPTTNSWSFPGSMTAPRFLHQTVLLPSGQVLLMGGYNQDSAGKPYALATAELYDPATNNWSATGSMALSRYYLGATLLLNGKVLVMGGSGDRAVYLSSAEVYDPATATWSSTGSLNIGRYEPMATRLTSGKVLISGGVSYSSYMASSEVYDPATGTWSPTGSMALGRTAHTATLLPNGKVLVIGGYAGSATSGGPTASVELYDPATGTWSPTASMASARYYHTATLLSSGKVLVTGGYGSSGALNTAELYDPAASP